LQAGKRTITEDNSPFFKGRHSKAAFPLVLINVLHFHAKANTKCAVVVGLRCSHPRLFYVVFSSLAGNPFAILLDSGEDARTNEIGDGTLVKG
jgi:hypothetical protein